MGCTTVFNVTADGHKGTQFIKNSGNLTQWKKVSILGDIRQQVIQSSTYAFMPAHSISVLAIFTLFSFLGILWPRQNA